MRFHGFRTVREFAKELNKQKNFNASWLAFERSSPFAAAFPVGGGWQTSPQPYGDPIRDIAADNPQYLKVLISRYHGNGGTSFTFHIFSDKLDAYYGNYYSGLEPGSPAPEACNAFLAFMNRSWDPIVYEEKKKMLKP